MNIRTIRNKRNSGSGKIISGTILATLFGLATVGCAISKDMDNILPMLVCASMMILGISFIIKGVKRNRSGSTVATDFPKFDEGTPDFVQDRIRELMKETNSSTVTVSRTTKRVTYTNSDGTTHTTETTTETRNDSAPSQSTQPGNVTCPSCGAIAQLRRGQNAVCEYCGNHIQG